MTNMQHIHMKHFSCSVYLSITDVSIHSFRELSCLSVNVEFSRETTYSAAVEDGCATSRHSSSRQTRQKSLPFGHPERVFRVVFCMLLGFDSFRSVSTAHRLLHYPQVGFAAILHFRATAESLYRRFWLAQ